MPQLGDIDVETSREGDVAVVSVTGEVDIVTSEKMRGALVDAAAGRGVTRLVIDLSGVSFLDSTGLGMMAAVTRKLRSGSQDVTLCCVQPQLVRLLELMGMHKHWKQHDSRAEACAPD